MVERIKNTIPPVELLDSKWINLKADLLSSRNNHDANSKCYRDATIESLTNQFKNKCAICERDRGFELQVDHYRPKKPRTNQTHTQHNNPGYYWLTYTWSNLIPLCSTCNQQKSNKFPLSSRGTRVTDHVNSQGFNPFDPFDISWLQQTERPLLLNPEVDQNLNSHLIYDKNGKIRGLTDRGKETIKVFKLNRRDLKRQRITIKNEIVKQIILSFNRYLNHRSAQMFKGALETTFDRLVHGSNIDHAFSLYHTYIFKYFDYFIGSKMPRTLRIKLLDYFKEYKDENGL